MLKRISIVSLSLLLLIIVSAGCSQSDSSTEKSATSVQDGAKKMISLTSRLKEQLSSQPDAGEVKSIGEDLEATWATFEDNVKKNNKTIYKEVEDSLDPLVTGTKQDKLDKSILTNLNQKLEKSLQQLADKSK